jgi:hypothetical protein
LKVRFVSSHGIWSEATVNELSVKVKVPVIAALATVLIAFSRAPVLLRLYFQLMPFFKVKVSGPTLLSSIDPRLRACKV